MITGFTTLTSTNVAQRIISTKNLFNYITFWGYSGFLSGVPLANASSAYVGININKLPVEVSAGSPAGITLDLQHKDDLNNYFVIGASGDGLCYYGW